jgi:hypothetical protein
VCGAGLRWRYGDGLRWRYGDDMGVTVRGDGMVCVFPSGRGEVMSIALGDRVEVKWAKVMAFSVAQRMHSLSYSGFAMLVP